MLKGKTVAIDATTLEANAAMRSIVRRDTGESYQAFLTGLATASGIETPTREDLARVDKKRKKKTSNTEWTNPHDPDAKVNEDERLAGSHLAPQSRACGRPGHRRHCRRHRDMAARAPLRCRAPEQVEDAQRDGEAPQALDELVGDKGYHSNQTMVDLDAVGIAVVHRRAGPRPPRLVGGAGRAGAGLWQSPPDAWTTRTAPDAATR